MSVHITPLSNGNLNLVLRVYPEISDPDAAYKHRLDFSICLASFRYKSRVAWLHGLHGTIRKEDYLDICERLYKAYRINEVRYERAKGYLVSLKRQSYRKWKPRRIQQFEMKVANFSGMPEI